MSASGTKRSWRVAFDEPPKTQAKACDHPGCSGHGEYRAPKSRETLNEYYWFCLDHVRAYNAAWDFYRGMGPEEIESEIRKSTTWARDTWPMGSKTSNRRFNFTVHDPFGVYDEVVPPKQKPAQATPEDKARALLGVKPDVTIKELKARFRELVKQHHPDANGGDKQSEETFKRINQAYTLLMASLTQSADPTV